MSTSGQSTKNNGKAASKGAGASSTHKLEKEVYDLRQSLKELKLKLKTQGEILNSLRDNKSKRNKE